MSSHQKLLLVQSDIRLITEKMDKINLASLNMPNLSALLSHRRTPVELKEEIKNLLITDLSHEDNNQVVIEEEPQLKEWPTFKDEGEYDQMSSIQTIDMLQEDYAIPDELVTRRLHSLFEKLDQRWYYGIGQTNGKNTWSWWQNETITKWENYSWR
ncbi:hypothetical protein O181_116479 [Austropuccinia psidii MF-1]|uniref:Uncharacterized protein n=1 Tax=Austropuccinia psidii MF-1 TaxID=1389203 RepID=A0A9Q3K8X2_9BASI|nr:hypothetical protein [Austropuccinia psidii MF-1]